jgi:TonB family protein
MEQGYSQHGFVLSLTLHLAVAVTVAALTWFKPFQRSAPRVFEVIQIPRGSPGLTAPNDGSSKPFDLPDTPRSRPTPARSTPPPRATPAPARPTPPVAPPQNVVTPPRTVTQPAPTPSRVTVPPAPAPTPAQDRISYRDFVDQHGKPQTRSPRPNTTTRPPVSAPRIDTRFAVNLSDAVRTPGSLTGMTDAQQSELGLYIGTLKDALQRNWDKPSGVPAATEAVVEFDLSASGRVTNVRIVEKSGNAVFDASVLAAFARLTTVGPTPDGREFTLRLTFRMKDE